MSANQQAIINLLETIRSSVETLLILLQEAEDAGACQHPESEREDISTMGQAMWKCRACGHINIEEE